MRQDLVNLAKLERSHSGWRLEKWKQAFRPSDVSNLELNVAQEMIWPMVQPPRPKLDHDIPGSQRDWIWLRKKFPVQEVRERNLGPPLRKEMRVVLMSVRERSATVCQGFLAIQFLREAMNLSL